MTSKSENYDFSWNGSLFGNYPRINRPAETKEEAISDATAWVVEKEAGDEKVVRAFLEKNGYYVGTNLSVHIEGLAGKSLYDRDQFYREEKIAYKKWVAEQEKKKKNGYVFREPIAEKLISFSEFFDEKAWKSEAKK